MLNIIKITHNKKLFMKNILLTGGLGFIGSHTVISLIQKGCKVYVVDSCVNSRREVINDINKILGGNINLYLRFFEGDIRNSLLLDQIFKEALIEKTKIDAVVHFAALKSSEQSIKNPLLYWDNNLNGTISLLNKMDKYECNNLVFSSSAYIYGLSDQEFISEKEEINPTTPYGKTKAAIELLLNDLYKSNSKKWKIINLRYFNPIGCHTSGFLGEFPKGKPNNIFPIILRIASGDCNKLKIYGNNWPTKDGTCIRDYIHVMDLADAHIAALYYLEKSKSIFKTFNIGTGKGTSVLELVNTFSEVNNIKLPYEFVDRRNGDVSNLVADNSLAISTLDWRPKNELSDMCIDGWRWRKKFLKP